MVEAGRGIGRSFTCFNLREIKRERDKLGAYRYGGRRHAGIDIYNDERTTVKASLDGTVVRASGHETYGNLVIIDHTSEIEDGKDREHRCYVYTLYAHLYSARTGLRGQRVRQGDIIGGIGNTGNAKGMDPHLHFETIRGQRG